MADQIELGELLGIVDDAGVRRDQWGRYMIVPPAGGPPVGYRRVTTVAKALDAEGGLIPWSQSRVLLGAVRDPMTMRKVRTLVGRHVDPWYEAAEVKAAFKTMINDLARTGGREEKAILGTHLHAVAANRTRALGLARARGELEAVAELDVGDQLWLSLYERALLTAGVVIDPAYVETLVVHDAFTIAGMADYLRAKVPGFELPLVADLKTGDEGSLQYALAGWCIQIAVYQAADNVYVQGAAADGSQDERHPMPATDAEHGLVISAPASGTPPQLLIVDLAAGRRAFELALEVERWRARDDLATVLDLTPALEASLEAVAETRTAAAALNEAMRAWLQGRIDDIGRHERARATLNRWWPEGVPPLRRADDHTPEQLAAIEAVVDRVEGEHSLPFPARRPGDMSPREAARLAAVLRGFAGATIVSPPSPSTKE